MLSIKRFLPKSTIRFPITNNTLFVRSFCIPKISDNNFYKNELVKNNNLNISEQKLIRIIQREREERKKEQEHNEKGFRNLFITGLVIYTCCNCL